MVSVENYLKTPLSYALFENITVTIATGSMTV